MYYEELTPKALTLLDFEFGILPSAPHQENHPTSGLTDPESYGISLPEKYLRRSETAVATSRAGLTRRNR